MKGLFLINKAAECRIGHASSCGYDHRAPLVRWLLHKYKCLWGVEGKGRDSNLQEGVSHTYTLRNANGEERG